MEVHSSNSRAKVKGLDVVSRIEPDVEGWLLEEQVDEQEPTILCLGHRRLLMHEARTMMQRRRQTDEQITSPPPSLSGAG